MDDNGKVVVGDLVRPLRKQYGPTEETARAFAFGFACGQMEKVYLGACTACMFRPSRDAFEWYFPQVRKMAEHFGLGVSLLPSHCPETPTEIWVHKGPIGKWLECEVNSPDWHHYRGRACGVWPEDHEYHKREGYGKKCD